MGSSDYYGARKQKRRLDDRNLQHAAALALLSGLADFAAGHLLLMVFAARSLHILHRDAVLFHGARFGKRERTCDPIQGKGQAEQQEQQQVQASFHAAESSPGR